MSLTQISDPEKVNILVVGDVMLDYYIYGDCNRISPEAPVPVVEVKSENYTLGGAGNVVENIHSFGSNVDIISVVGDDENGKLILKKLSECNVSGNGLVIDNNRCTTTKTRILAAKHQLIRIDREITVSIDSDIEEAILELVKTNIGKYQIVLLSDYNKGMLTESLLGSIFKFCKKNNVKTIVDTKGVNFKKYEGANIIKPNKKEATAATGIVITNNETLTQACAKIKQLTDCDDVIITMSEDGIALYSNEELVIIPTKAIDVVDVTGAGDTVLASLGVALAAGNSLRNACDFANHAAAIVVSKTGSATVSLNEINERFGN